MEKESQWNSRHRHRHQHIDGAIETNIAYASVWPAHRSMFLSAACHQRINIYPIFTSSWRESFINKWKWKLQLNRANDHFRNGIPIEPNRTEQWQNNIQIVPLFFSQRFNIVNMCPLVAMKRTFPSFGTSGCCADCALHMRCCCCCWCCTDGDVRKRYNWTTKYAIRDTRRATRTRTLTLTLTENPKPKIKSSERRKKMLGRPFCCCCFCLYFSCWVFVNF